MKILDRIEGPRGTVVVYQHGNLRKLCFAANPKLTHASMFTDRPTAYRSEFIELMRGALAAVPEPRRILLLGLGGGALARLALEACPEAEIDAVEIDSAVATAAIRWFGLEPQPRLRVHIADAADFLRQHQPPRFDLAWVDCFGPRRIPPHLATRAFTARVARCADVVCTNLIRTHPGYHDLLRNWCEVLHRPWRVEGRRSTNHVVFGRAAGPLCFDHALAERLGVTESTTRAAPILP